MGEEVLFLRSQLVLPLGNLPPLMWEAICAFLCPTDLHCLGLSCKRMKFILGSYVGENRLEIPRLGELDRKWEYQDLNTRTFLKSRELSSAINRGQEIPKGLQSALFIELEKKAKLMWTKFSWTLPWAPVITLPASLQPMGLSKQLHQYQIDNLTW